MTGFKWLERMKGKCDSFFTEVGVPQRPPGAKPFRRKGLHGSQEVPPSAFLSQGSHQHLTTSRDYWEQQKSSQISVGKICIFAVLTPHTFLNGKRMSA